MCNGCRCVCGERVYFIYIRKLSFKKKKSNKISIGGVFFCFFQVGSKSFPLLQNTKTGIPIKWNHFIIFLKKIFYASGLNPVVHFLHIIGGMKQDKVFANRINLMYMPIN